MTRRRLRRLLLVLALLPAACGDDDAADGAGELTVLAASSLTEAFTALEATFETAHAGVDVRLQFGASSALARQLADGAPADVFASADERTMRSVVDGDLVRSPTAFARNRLVLVVEPGNPKRVEGLDDLRRDGVVFVACAREVPCGSHAARALALADVARAPASREENVKAVLTKVVLGEADAGLVYVTDARAAGPDVHTVELGLDRAASLRTTYEVAVTADGDQQLGAAWVALVTSSNGQRVLRRLGFLAA